MRKEINEYQIGGSNKNKIMIIQLNNVDVLDKLKDAIKYFDSTYNEYLKLKEKRHELDFIITDLIFHANVILETNKYLKLYIYNKQEDIQKINAEYEYIQALNKIFDKEKFLEYFYNYYIK